MQTWTEVVGGLYQSPELSKSCRLVAQKKTTLFDLVDPGTEFHIGKKSGDTVAYRIRGRISGVADTALQETQKVPMVKPPEYEGSAVVSRYGVAIPWTGVREDLDRLATEDANVYSLNEHSGRTHNKLIRTALVAGRSFTYVAKTATTNVIKTDATVADQAAIAYSAWHARQIAKVLEDYNTPHADGKNYFACVSTTMKYDLLNDSTSTFGGFVNVKQYADGGAEGLLEGEIGMYMNVRYSVDNDCVLNAIGANTAFGEGFFVGWEACKEILVYPMELIVNTNLGGDFGQQKAMAWLSLLAYKTPWIYATHGQGAVLHYTST